ADALDRRGVPAQPDGHGEPSVGPAGELERAVRAWSRKPGQRPQRAALRDSLDPAGTAAARLCPGVARNLALLGDRRKSGLSGRALQADLDDPRLLTGAYRIADGAGRDRRRRRGNAEGRRRSVRRGAPASALLAPLSRASRAAADSRRNAAQWTKPKQF